MGTSESRAEVSDSESGTPRSLGRFPGPKVVIGCFLILNTTAGFAFYGLAVYLNAFSREKGWDVSSISLATTLFFMVSGLSGLGVARMLQRHDARAVVSAGGVAGAVALALLGQVEQRWQLYLVYSLFALGFSAAGLIPMTTVVTRWYHRKRSIALAVASTGLSVGGIVVTPGTKAFLDRVSLSSATPVLAVLWLVGTVPFALLLIKPEPARYGWMPDGEPIEASRPAPEVTGTSFDEAIRTRFFLGVTIGYILVLGSQVGAIQQIVKLVEERTTPGTAAFATVFLSGTSVIARLIGGHVANRVPLIGFLAVLGIVQGVALGLIAFANSTVPLFAAIVLFGMTIGNILMLQPLVIVERFGVREYPRIYSRATFFAMFGTAAGPLLLGWLYDHAGGYRTAYLVGGAGSVLGACVWRWSGPASPAPAVDRPAPAPEVPRIASVSDS